MSSAAPQGLNRQRKAVNGSRVLVLGIAYKKNTNDARETPADPIVRGLLELGAEVVVHDDHVGPNALDLVAERVALTDSEVARADATCSSPTTTTWTTTS